MARKSGKKKKKQLERIILRTGEALVEADPAWSAAEPEVVIGDLDGPVGNAIAGLLGDQIKGHSLLPPDGARGEHIAPENSSRAAQL